MSLHRYRPVALVLVVLHLNACTSWQPISLQTGPVPEKVRITTENDRFVLNDTRVVGDTAIAGWLGGMQERRRNPGDARRFILMSDVLQLERGNFDPLRTLGAVAGIGIAVAGVLLMIACSDSDFC